jgi:hypothetical protein
MIVKGFLGAIRAIVWWTLLLALVGTGDTIAGCRAQEQGQDTKKVKYRLLWDWDQLFGPDPGFKRYDISVERWVNKEELQALVCSVVRDQHPSDYHTLRIIFLYDYDDYLPSLGDDPNARRRYYEHSVGYYFWNDYWAETNGGGRLVLSRDEMGDEKGGQEVFFDHLKCDK